MSWKLKAVMAAMVASLFVADIAAQETGPEKRAESEGAERAERGLGRLPERIKQRIQKLSPERRQALKQRLQGLDAEQRRKVIRRLMSSSKKRAEAEDQRKGEDKRKGRGERKRKGKGQRKAGQRRGRGQRAKRALRGAADSARGRRGEARSQRGRRGSASRKRGPGQIQRPDSGAQKCPTCGRPQARRASRRQDRGPAEAGRLRSARLRGAVRQRLLRANFEAPRRARRLQI